MAFENFPEAEKSYQDVSTTMMLKRAACVVY